MLTSHRKNGWVGGGGCILIIVSALWSRVNRIRLVDELKCIRPDLDLDQELVNIHCKILDFLGIKWDFCSRYWWSSYEFEYLQIFFCVLRFDDIMIPENMNQSQLHCQHGISPANTVPGALAKSKEGKTVWIVGRICNWFFYFIILIDSFNWSS